MANKTQFIVTGTQKIHCEASAETQRVIVETDPDRVGPEEVRERLDLLGYEVKSEGGAA